MVKRLSTKRMSAVTAKSGPFKEILGTAEGRYGEYVQGYVGRLFPKLTWEKEEVL